MTSRRIFLKNGACALVSLGFAPTFLTRTARAATPGTKVLIVVFQRGAVDGLNMIVPFGERAYYQARPTIAIAPPGRDEGALDLDGFFGLHPSLSLLEPLYDANLLAVVHASGSPDATRSHFDAQDYMESATPGVKSTSDGWLARVLAARRVTHDTPFRAVAMAQQLPRALQGTAGALAIGDLSRFGIRGGAPGSGVEASFEAEYATATDKAFAASGTDAFEAVRMLRATDPAKYVPVKSAQYPSSAFGQALRQIAQLVKAGVGLEIAFAETGQWDHHINQGGATGQLATRFDDFGRGLAAIVTDLGDRLDDVVILTMSEFGRTVVENGSRGTDHGHGNAMLAIGGRVRGGMVYATWPGLAREQRYEGRDLAVTTDFRDVFGEIVVRHLDVRDTSSVFPGYPITPQRFRGIMRGG